MVLPDFARLSIMVAGDIMLDRYVSGSTSRVSPEAPIPVVKRESSHNALGGAANVAYNLATLGATVELAGLVGDDSTGQEILSLLGKAGIGNQCLVDKRVTSIEKTRVISRQQQLLRIDTENAMPADCQQQLLANTGAHLQKQSALIISDYAKGSFDDFQPLIARCRELGIPVLVDPKGSDYSRYAGATLITPNRGELETVVGSCASEDELFARAANLREQLDLQAIVVTLSEKGLAVIEKDKPPVHLPARAREVFDVTGAGDTTMALLAACLAGGDLLVDAAHVANTAAAIAVGKFGAAPVTIGELRAALAQSRVSATQVVVTEDELKRLVANARAAGEKVVMTNGCFDLLHPGHINLLSEVAKEGDRLIVAVNSDDSVKRLKGEERPINDLADRMAMLAGLKCVDWVVAFSEDTPQRLIANITPDVLVKGGDYKAEEIVGYKEVTAAGGEVKVLGFMQGFSSTGLIEKIKKLDS